MSLKRVQTQTFEVKTHVIYVESESKPEEQKYFFAYKVSIKNNSNQAAQLINRHWIITDGLGHIEEVRGPGVVGLQPRIAAGQVFEYDSACPLKTSSGTMRGFYEFMGDDGEPFQVEIKEFFLVSPQALN